MNRIELPGWKRAAKVDSHSSTALPPADATLLPNTSPNSNSTNDSANNSANDSTNNSTNDATSETSPFAESGSTGPVAERASHASHESAASESSDASDVRRAAGEPAVEFAHQLFGPLHYEPKYAYPLLIWLHGAGDDERQLQQIMPLVSLRNYVAIGPRGGCRSHDDRSEFHWGRSLGAICQAEQAVEESLAAATERFHVNREKIFLAGYGSGGTMALRVALRNPELFAGAASLGGGFPRGEKPLVALPRLRGFKMLLGCGRDSRRYPVDRLCEDLRLFHTAGLSVAVRQYPCGDELRTPMLADLNRWMMQIVTGQSCEDTAPSDWELPAAESN